MRGDGTTGDRRERGEEGRTDTLQRGSLPSSRCGLSPAGSRFVFLAALVLPPSPCAAESLSDPRLIGAALIGARCRGRPQRAA